MNGSAGVADIITVFEHFCWRPACCCFYCFGAICYFEYCYGDVSLVLCYRLCQCIENHEDFSGFVKVGNVPSDWSLV